jgi:hypothetical protein
MALATTASPHIRPRLSWCACHAHVEQDRVLVVSCLLCLLCHLAARLFAITRLPFIRHLHLLCPSRAALVAARWCSCDSVVPRGIELAIVKAFVDIRHCAHKVPSPPTKFRLHPTVLHHNRSLHPARCPRFECPHAFILRLASAHKVWAPRSSLAALDLVARATVSQFNLSK